MGKESGMVSRKEASRMNRKNIAEKNLRLGYEFSRYLIEHPAFARKISSAAEIVFLPTEDQTLCRENLKIAASIRARGGKPVLVRIGRIAPPRSRLRLVRVENGASTRPTL
jgi:hypothetical protein